MRSLAAGRGPAPAFAYALLAGLAVCSLLVAGLAIEPASGGQPRTAAGNITPGLTTMEVVLGTDGDARWTITTRFALESESERRAFDRLATEFEADDTDILAVTPFREAASRATASTGRQMRITNVSRSADRADGTGVLTLAFTWTDFTRVDGDRLLLGDVFRTPSGTWLPRLAEDQELVIEFPERYSVVDSSRPLRSGSFHIQGPARFEPGQPSAVLEQTNPPSTTTTRNGTAPGGDTSPGAATPDRQGSVPISLGIGLFLALAVMTAYLVVRRERGAGAGGVDDGGPPTDGAGDGPAVDGAGPADIGKVDAPLLSDEERVLRLLESNGGRMKQVAIVEETDWSNAKVSQLLSEMAEKDQIDKLRIGRENLISLPDESPRDVR